MSLKRLTDFLIGHGIDRIGHSNKTYLAHLIAVYRYLERMGCGEEVARAGMFHSIYGTELFQGFKLPLEDRAQVRDLIGARAERLAYLNCAMDRASFDRAVAEGTTPHRFHDRLTGEQVELPSEDFDDLCRIHLYDWLEQLPRCARWDYRRPGYQAMAGRLGGVATAEFARIYAGEQHELAAPPSGGLAPA
jgi:hypothetical protein